METVRGLEGLDSNIFSLDSDELESLVAPACEQALAPKPDLPDLSPELLQGNGEFKESGYIGIFHWIREATSGDQMRIKIFHWAKFTRRSLNITTLLESSLLGQGTRRYDALGSVVLLDANSSRTPKDQDKWVLRCDTHVMAPTLRAESAPQIERPFGVSGHAPTVFDQRSLELAQQVLKTRAERTGRTVELIAQTNRGEVARALAGKGWVGQTETDQEILSATLAGKLPTTPAIRNGRKDESEEVRVPGEWLLKPGTIPVEGVPTLNTPELDFAGTYQQVAPNLKLVHPNLLA